MFHMPQKSFKKIWELSIVPMNLVPKKSNLDDEFLNCPHWEYMELVRFATDDTF